MMDDAVKSVYASVKILDLIENSSDQWLKGRYLQSPEYLDKICFSDVMDVVLYHISLQPDLNKVSRVLTTDFNRLCRNKWDKWIENKDNRFFLYLGYPWTNEPGPMYGSAGYAECYFSLYPGPMRYDYLLDFFSHPKGSPSVNPSWHKYKEKHIERMVFPKWRRLKKKDRIISVFNLSEMILEQLRERRFPQNK